MVGMALKIQESGQSKCKRCGRWFQPKEPDQEYGPICSKKMAGFRKLSDAIIEVRDRKGDITAVIV